MNRKNMQKRWPVLLAVLSMILIVISGNYYINDVQEALLKKSVTDVMEVTIQGAHSFEVYMNKDMEMLHSLARNISRSGSGDKEAILRQIQIFDDTGTHYAVFNLDDGMFYSSQVEEGSTIPAQRLAYYSSLSGSGVEEPYLAVDTGLRNLGCYECFTFADGKRGLVRKAQLLSDVAEEFSFSFYNDTGFSYIVDQEGNILIRSSHKNSNHTFLNVFDVVDLEGNSQSAVDEFRSSLKKGKRGVVRFTGTGQQEYVYAYTPLAGIDGWYLISIIPNHVIMEQGDQILRSSQLFMFIIMVGIFVLVLFAILMWQNRRNMEKMDMEVRYREQMFNILANNTEDVFIMFDLEDRTVEYVSPNVARVLGIPAEEIKADLSVLNSGTGGRLPDDETLLAMVPGSSFSEEQERTHRENRERHWFMETVHRINIDDMGKFIVVLSDRTAEKKKQQTLEQALEIANVANKAKSTFLSNMSHDIRTPMNAIVGLCTLLQRDADNPDRVRDHTKKITASSQHLLGLINDVLDMSKIESGKTTLNISEIDLAEIVEELGTIIRPQAKARHQDFSISVYDVKTEQLLGDKLRINQIMINILSNAVKYTQVGGKIEMSIRQLPQTAKNYANIQFMIRDNGMGMSKEYLETIFDPFTREENTTISRIQGTGLGMAITKGLVELMGGTIDVQSSPGEGSTFTVCLELRIQEVEVDQDFWAKYGVTRTLIVDDEVEVCTSVISAMAGTGVSMQFALNGLSAIKMVEKAHKQKRDFDLVLLDMKMPGMDGIETARHIREILPTSVPIMILTAYDWSDIEEEAIAAGISGFLPKPFFFSNFKLTIERLMEKENTVQDQVSALNGKHILVAEDNELNSEILVEMLDMMGVTCDVAENGQVALEKFQKSEPGEYDYIFMDVQMPVMNGYEATRAIRASDHPAARTIPIIAMTANAFAEDIKDALDAGMDAHVSKPIDLGKLESVVRDIQKAV